MSIKKRLKKLEFQTGVNSEFCECYPRRNVEMYHADLTIDSDSNEPVLQGDPVPEMCPDCGRPIEKRIFIIQLVDQTTKERFPDEWQANR